LQFAINKVFKSKKAKKYSLILLGLIAGLVWLIVFSFPDNRLHLIFCDVGQGDATLIVKGFNQILIDGGPNEKVLDCLANNMPFFDKTIEVVALTHPEADHLTGIIPVMEKYGVKYFLSGPEGNESAVYAALISKIKNQISKTNLKFKIVNLYAGDRIRLGEIVLDSLWPTREWMAENLEVGSEKLEAGNITPPTSSSSFPPPTSHFVLGAKATDAKLNDYCLVFLLTYRGKKVLLMGDADSRVQDKITGLQETANSLNRIDILKFPHHGSKTGMTKEFIEQIKPKEAIISVGKNSYGHPTSEALDLLKSFKVVVRRTDMEGEIKYEF